VAELGIPPHLSIISAHEQHLPGNFSTSAIAHGFSSCFCAENVAVGTEGLGDQEKSHLSQRGFSELTKRGRRSGFWTAG
jgi:hypothetical protein